MEPKLKELILILFHNIRGVTELGKLNTILPLKEDGLHVYIKDAKVFVERDNEEISYFFIEGKFVSNLKLLKRLVYPRGIELTGESTVEINHFEECIKKLLQNTEEDR